MKLSKQQIADLIEDRREMEFRQRSLSTLLHYARRYLPKRQRDHIESAWFRLVAMHVRGEEPLTWMFDDTQVIAAPRGTLERARVIGPARLQETKKVRRGQ